LVVLSERFIDAAASREPERPGTCVTASATPHTRHVPVHSLGDRMPLGFVRARLDGEAV